MSMFDTPEWKAMQAACQAAENERLARINNHPDNGKLGWWFIDGIRHYAHVRASSAPEAVKKALDLVGDWEMPSVTFLGEELPDVF